MGDLLATHMCVDVQSHTLKKKYTKNDKKWTVIIFLKA